jgi:O-antigen/teichoic acid export membrane protein
MSARGEIFAGVLDAALSSLATFTVGLYAARALDPTVLGAYGLVFTAFLVATRFPSQLIFKPAELIALSLPSERRMDLLGRTLTLGLGPALLAALALSLWVVLAPTSVPADAVVALTLTGMFSAFVSPIQDHVRHVLHLGNSSWAAAIVSGVQAAAALAGLWLLSAGGLPDAWVPLGALGLANLLSLSIGLLYARSPHVDRDALPALRFKGLVQPGRWLLLVALLPTGAAFVAAALVVHLAGSAAMGYAEAGRVLGQPPWVLSMGLAAVLGPRSARAAQQGDLAAARAVSRLFAGIMLLLALPYLLLVGIGWSWSPFARLIPSAYQVPHLVLINILGSTLIGMDWPYRAELIGVGRSATLARLEASANAARVTIAGAAGVLGAFAIPTGYIAMAVVRSVGYRMVLPRQYGSTSEGRTTTAPCGSVAQPQSPVLARDGAGAAP